MLNYEYKEYERYLKTKYSIPAFIEMYNDADIDCTIGKTNSGLWFTINEDGIRDVYDTDKEFFNCINILDLKPYEEEYGWMY